MNKAFNNFTWEDEPSINTPINAQNLNKQNNAIDIIDNRVVTHEVTKLDVVTANTMVKDVTFDETTGIFTVIKLNGSMIRLDTKLEKMMVNFTFDRDTQILSIILEDGTTQPVDLSAFVTQYEFGESDTIILTVDANGKVVGNIKSGSITGDMLEPNYLANVTTQADVSSAASVAAVDAADRAEAAADAATLSEETASDMAETATSQATVATTQAGVATDKADAARISAETAETKAKSASDSADVAAEQAVQASASADAANASNVEAATQVGRARSEADRSESAAQTATSQADRSESEADRAESAADRAEAATGLTVDEELSESSVNPIQNKAVASAINGIIDGSTQVGNASTLDGHDSGEFVLKSGNSTIDGNLTARTFIGDLAGVADCASSDSDGNDIVSTYVKVDWLEAGDYNIPNANYANSAGSADAVAWGNVSGKPSTFTPSTHTHTKSQITDFPTSMTPTAHNQSASTITAGTFAGAVVANATAVATLTTKQTRNIYFGTTELTAGSSALPAGDMYFQYE